VTAWRRERNAAATIVEANSGSQELAYVGKPAAAAKRRRQMKLTETKELFDQCGAGAHEVTMPCEARTNNKEKKSEENRKSDGQNL
jgi:hypothetical protein